MEIEDLGDNVKKKRVNSGDKGKRTERSLAKILTERFGPGFSRTIGSGNRIWQVGHMPKCAQDTFTGDLVTPDGFLWVFESKGGYDIDFNSVFGGGSAELDSFIEQARKEGDRTSRKPVICWKKDRRPWLVILRTEHLHRYDFDFRFVYKHHSVISLTDFLQAEDSYFKSPTAI